MDRTDPSLAQELLSNLSPFLQKKRNCYPTNFAHWTNPLFDLLILHRSLRHRDQSGNAADCGLDLQAAGISLAAELGELSAERKNGARTGAFDAALRRAAPHGHRPEQPMGDTPPSLVTGEVENQHAVRVVLRARA